MYFTCSIMYLSTFNFLIFDSSGKVSIPNQIYFKYFYSCLFLQTLAGFLYTEHKCSGLGKSIEEGAKTVAALTTSTSSASAKNAANIKSVCERVS